MPNPQVINTITLINMNGENLCEYLVLDNPNEASVQPWVKCIPFFGMHEMYRMEPSNQIAVQAGMVMPASSFLGYIAMIIRNTRNAAYPYEMASYGANYVRLKLIQPMNAKEIAQLTQFPLEMVKDYYRSHFIVDVTE
jgi:hypothetical protein